MRWPKARHGATAVILFLIFVIFLSYRGVLNNISYQVPVQPPPGAVDQTPLVDKAPDFVQRPVWTYKKSVALNSASCPTIGINFDAGTIKNNEKAWRDITTTQISRWRHDIAEYLSLKHKQEQENPSLKASPIARGIVMAAGDHNAAIRARTNIRFLRSYNCTLPIEIFHSPNELAQSDEQLLSELSGRDSLGGDVSDMNVTLRVVEGIGKSNGWKEFQIKAPAIQQSSFDEILYLDTDSYPLRNPEFMFEGKHWQDTGLLLWPDYTKSHPTNPLWRLLGIPCRNEYEGESGQIFISRSRHQDILWVAEYFAIHHTDYYGFMGGDRDSFRAAALLLGKEWAGPGRLNAAAGVAPKGRREGGGHTMLQADPDGKWMFVHANLIKHGSFPRPLFARIRRATQDRYQGTRTYGNIDPPNDKLGEGVKVRVDQSPRIETFMEAFEGYENTLVVEEEWESYDELKGFEKKWFELGSVH